MFLLTLLIVAHFQAVRPAPVATLHQTSQPVAVLHEPVLTGIRLK